MADDDDIPAQAPPEGAGPRLKAAREAAGLTLAQISALTKIPERMLRLIEAGDYAALPARTYATGFTRTYARALALDEAEYVAAVRRELGLGEAAEVRHAPSFEPGDPARVPTVRFALVAAAAALAVIAAGLSFWRTYYAPAVTLPPILPSAAPRAAPTPTPRLAPAPPAAAPAAGLPTTAPAVRTPAPAPAPAPPAAAPTAAAPAVAAPAGEGGATSTGPG